MHANGVTLLAISELARLPLYQVHLNELWSLQGLQHRHAFLGKMSHSSYAKPCSAMSMW